MRLKNILIVAFSFLVIGVSSWLTYFYLSANQAVPEPTTAPAGSSSEAKIQIPSMVTAEDFNVIIIGWDGVQRDHFWECYDKELPGCEDGLPNLKALSDDTIYDLTVTSGATATKPGWSQILSGYDAATTGIENNTEYQPLPGGYSIFEKLEDAFGSDNIATIFLAGKGEHVGGACVGDEVSSNVPVKKAQPETELLGQPYCLTKTSLDVFQNALGENEVVGQAALDALETYQDERFFAFFHFADPDETGHKEGENSQAYTDAIIDDDQWLGQIMAKLDELGLSENTYVFVVTDHGYDEGQVGHLNAPFGFYATNNPGVIRSGDRMDVTPTILSMYGFAGTENGAPALIGLPLQEPDPRSCIPQGDAFIDYPGAPACCAGLTPSDMSKGGKAGKPVLEATGGAGDDSGICQ